MANETQTDHPSDAQDVRDTLFPLEESVLRARDQDHYNLIVNVAVAQWMLENPYPDISPEATKWAKDHAAREKIALADFERNGYTHQSPPEEP